MIYLMWLISVPSLIFFSLMLFTNWRIFYHNYIKKDSTTSVIPLMGGIAGVIGLWMMPNIEVGLPWLFVPFLVEWGSVPLLLVSLFSFLNNKA